VSIADDPLNTALHEYYELGKEADRLTRTGSGRLEFERTREIVLRHLPPAPATVADIGGGPGRYSLWLAGLGYRVVHRDLVPMHVEQLGSVAGPGAGIDSAVGDARSLDDLADESADAVLLFGPLYHLVRPSDRMQVLREAARIVRSGGPVFGVAISRWATRLDAMLRLRVYRELPDAPALIGPVERTGILPPLAPGGFNGYTHRPDELRSEFAAAGLEVADLVAVEGAAYLLGDIDERMADDQDRQVILETARAHERVPELMGLGSHLLATGIRL
jgi:SAM-dependent methyltransferase